MTGWTSRRRIWQEGILKPHSACACRCSPGSCPLVKPLLTLGATGNDLGAIWYTYAPEDSRNDSQAPVVLFRQALMILQVWAGEV